MLSELSGDAVRPLCALRISPTRAAFHDSFFCKPSSKAKTRTINILLSHAKSLVSCAPSLEMGKGSTWIREWSAHTILIIRATQQTPLDAGAVR